MLIPEETPTNHNDKPQNGNITENKLSTITPFCLKTRQNVYTFRLKNYVSYKKCCNIFIRHLLLIESFKSNTGTKERCKKWYAIYTRAAAGSKESRLKDILTEKMQENMGPRYASRKRLI